jgi:Protein of unknown function (DUF3040)
VVTVLDPNEKYIFDDMVTQLRGADPKFARRVDQIGHPRRTARVGIAVLLWMVAPVCIYFGGWTGLLMAVVGAGFGTHLMLKRTGFAGNADGFSWWSSSRRSSLGG